MTLTTYLEEVRAKFYELPWIKKLVRDGGSLSIPETNDFLTSSTTEAYVLGLKRALELLPKPYSVDEKKYPLEQFQSTHDESDGWNAYQAQAETALNDELKKRSV